MDAKSNPEYYDYTVKSGDTISGIIFKMYGFAPTDSRYRKALDFILSINPQIKDPNRIYAGKQIHIGVYSKAKPVSQQIPALALTQLGTFKNATSPDTRQLPQQDAEYFWALSWLEHNANLLVVPGSIATGATSNLLSPGNTTLVNKVSDLYAEYKSGSLTKGQYDSRRKAVLDQLKKNLGPMEKVLFGDKTTHETIRIARGGGVPPAANIEKNYRRLSRIASVGKYGGIALTGVGVASSCMQIANANDQHEKNEIFVETIASTATGLGGGYIVGLFLISNPIGWGTAIVLAAGATALSYSAGKFARHMYDRHGNKVDLVSGLGVDNICQ